MKKLIVVSALALLQTSLFAATGEVTLSGSTWTGKVDGTIKYTGSDMFAAANACIAAMSSGTVNLRNSGNSGSSGGAVKSITLKSSITFNGNGCTITGNSGDDLIVPIYCKRGSSVAVQNLNIAGRVRYGVWLETCQGMNIQNCNFNGSCLCPAFRFDNPVGSGSSLTIGTVSAKNGTASQSMGVETYGINGINIGTVNANNMGGCGLLLNTSGNGWTVGTVNGTDCCVGGGYAGFRCANNNGTGNISFVNSQHCGRGFFSCTQSHGAVVAKCNAANCTDIGIWIQDGPNTIVNSGTETANAGGCWSITGSSAGAAVHVKCQ